RPRNAFLNRAPHGVQRSHPRIARPRENQLARAARCDQLIEDEIRREPAEHQTPPTLADDFVRCGKGDEMGKALDDDDVAVVHEARDRLAHRHEFRPRARAQTRTFNSAKDSSRMRTPLSTASSSITSGGAMRMVLRPAPSSNSPRLKAASSSGLTKCSSGSL